MESMTEQHSHTVLVAEGAGSLEAAMLSLINDVLCTRLNNNVV